MSEIIEFQGYNVPVGNHLGKTIVIGSDHRGFKYKTKIIEHLKNIGFNIIDVGCDNPERCDYPEISKKIAKNVCLNINDCVGIGICGSGFGISIPASKFKGIFIATPCCPKEAETARKHNNTNFLGIGADRIEINTAIKTIDAWLKAKFYSDPETEDAYFKRFIQTLKIEEEIYNN